MKKTKKALSLILAICMLLGLVVIGNAASLTYAVRTQNYTFDSVTYGGAVAGCVTEIKHDSIAGTVADNATRVRIYLDLFADVNRYVGFDSANIVVNYDKLVFAFANSGSDYYDEIRTNSYNIPADGRVNTVVAIDDVQKFYDDYGSNPEVGRIYFEFRIVSVTEFFNRINAGAGGFEFTISTTNDFSVLKKDGTGTVNLGSALSSVPIDTSHSAFVTLDGYTVSYNDNGAEIGTVPAPVFVRAGDDYTIPNNISLSKVVGGVTYLLSHWSATEDGAAAGTYAKGAMFRMPAKNVVLTAEYSTDKDEDGIPDSDEWTVIYKLNNPANATLSFPATTVNGKFYDTSSSQGSINVEKGEVIGNAVPSVGNILPGYELIGYFVNGVKIPDIAAYKPIDDTEIEVRVAVSEVDVHIPGKIITEEPDPLNPGHTIPVENDNGVDMTLPAGAEVIHRDISGATLKTTVIDIAAVDASMIQNIVHPVPTLGSSTLPTKDISGNSFKAWALTGPVDMSGTVTYYLDPVYDDSVRFTVTDPGADPGDPPVFDQNVPRGTEYEVLDDKGAIIKDKNGDPAAGTINTDTDIDLPEVVDAAPGPYEIPSRNGNGEIFDGWEVIPTDNDGDGTPDKYTFKPKYKKPASNDVDIIPIDPNDPDAKSDGIDALTGDGYTILRGKWQSEDTTDIHFLMRIGGSPAIAADANHLTIESSLAYGFAAHIGKPINFGAIKGAVTYVGTKNVTTPQGTLTYGAFKISYETSKSSIVRVTASYTASDGIVSAGHVVITPADCDINTEVKAADFAKIQRVCNSIDATPGKTSSGNYLYELMDTDKNGEIRAADCAVVQRMLNEIIPTN